MTSKTLNKSSPEVCERAVRMVLDRERDHPSRWVAVVSIAAKSGCTGRSLTEWAKKAGRERGGATAEMAARLKALERENRELR